MDGDDEYVLVGEIKRMNAINSNQPLLALGLLFGLIFLSVYSFGIFLNKLEDIFLNNVSTTNTSAPQPLNNEGNIYVIPDSTAVTMDTMAVAVDSAYYYSPSEYQEMPAVEAPVDTIQYGY